MNQHAKEGKLWLEGLFYADSTFSSGTVSTSAKRVEQTHLEILNQRFPFFNLNILVWETI